ncbi:GAF domain-containing sensor histidine kinase [Geovibrio ferrireducens]|uniref:GAF domain-containing sensor histidine kinase n=1 Tax=Geovibrio ferrireducens TaxID=46201 RepID=UPI00224669F9|nr:GAF domain-containing sensor histidine kinase [Geovibrio ferrireducens]
MKNDLLEVLVEISEKMNSIFDVNDLLPSIISIAREYLGVKRSSLMLINGHRLSISAHSGFEIDPGNIEIALGEGIAGRVAETGVETVVNLSEESREEMGYRASSFMSVPVRTNNKVIGVLNLTDKEHDYFTEDDVRIARYIASQCALGIERFNLMKDMRKSENLRVIGMLNSSIAHDIKNLLNIVQSYLELIDITELDGEVADYIESIHSEVKRIHGLTLDLLDFSRQKVSINLVRFRVSDLFKDLAKQFRVLTRDTKVTVEFINEADPELWLDREKIFRMLFNLIGNAVDVLAEKGTVRVSAAVTDCFCEFNIYDNGKGIPQDMINKIFDPFFTSGKIKGTGLGLAIVKMIVEAHSGFICVDSKPGEYTVFKVRVPLRYEPT